MVTDETAWEPFFHSLGQLPHLEVLNLGHICFHECWATSALLDGEELRAFVEGRQNLWTLPSVRWDRADSNATITSLETLTSPHTGSAWSAFLFACFIEAYLSLDS